MDKLRTTIMLLIILAMFITVAVACVQPMKEELPEVTQPQENATYKVIPLFDINDNTDTTKTESVTEAITEPPVTVEETISSTPKYYNVNLSTEVQDVIFSECEKYGINPSIIIAMIERESGFDRYSIGDDGRSFGLMQIQIKWHIDRMIQLDCTDVFDPIENVTVGINYLAELQSIYGDITKALVAYNGGSYKGTITDYAYAVMARVNEINNMRCDNG